MNSTFRSVIKIGIGVVAVFILFNLLGLLAKVLIIKSIHGYVVEHVSQTFAVNPFLLKGLVALFLLPVALAFSWSGFRKYGITIGIASFAVLNIGMFFMSRNVLFNPEGKAIKQYHVTSEGIVLDGTGAKADGETGENLHPITPEIAALYKKAGREGFQQIDPSSAQWFNPYTQRAELFYGKNPDGGLDFFNLPLTHPLTGKKLQPVTEQVYSEWRALEQKRREKTAQLEAIRQAKEEEARQLALSQAQEEEARKQEAIRLAQEENARQQQEALRQAQEENARQQQAFSQAQEEIARQQFAYRQAQEENARQQVAFRQAQEDSARQNSLRVAQENSRRNAVNEWIKFIPQQIILSGGHGNAIRFALPHVRNSGWNRRHR
jgi:hypothetical protein